MKPSELLRNAMKIVKSNSPEILTALGIGGVVTTGYLAFKAGVNSTNPKYDTVYVGEQPDERKKMIDRAKATWKLYIPTGISGAATITCIIVANRSGGRRTAAAVAAYSLTERAFSEYKEKVIENVGKNKEEKVRTDIAQQRVLDNPMGGGEIAIVAGGSSLCFDMTSMRYFRSDYETLRRIENEINYQIVHERYVGLSEFYVLVGLQITKDSVNQGWTNDKLMELDIQTTLAENNEPCLTIDFNYIGPLP